MQKLHKGTLYNKKKAVCSRNNCKKEKRKNCKIFDKSTSLLCKFNGNTNYSRLNLLTLVNALGLIDIKQRFDLFIDYAFNKYIHLMILNNIK